MLYTSLNIPAQSSLFLLDALESWPSPPSVVPLMTPPLATFFLGRAWGGFWCKLFFRWFIHDRAGFWGPLFSAPHPHPHPSSTLDPIHLYFFYSFTVIVKVACQSYTRPDKCHWYLIKSGRPGIFLEEGKRSHKWYEGYSKNSLGWKDF